MDCSSARTSGSSSVPGAAKSALSSSTVESAMLAIMGSGRLLVAMLLLRVYVLGVGDSDRSIRKTRRNASC